MSNKLAIVLIALSFMVACQEKDGNPYSYDQQTIYSDNPQVLFREFAVILKPYVDDNGTKKYLLNDSVFNVEIRVNNKLWGKFSSLHVDTSAFDKEIINNFTVSPDLVKYAVLAPYALPEDTINTAGGYAALLNNINVLKPGDYIIELKYFQVRDNNGNLVTLKPAIVEWIEIQEGKRSAFIGEFEVKMN